MEEQRRTRPALGGDDAALIHQLADRVIVDDPERVGGGGQVVRRRDGTLAVAAGNQHQRAVILVHLVQIDGEVHRPRLRHLVVGLPGAVILVPLPDIAVEGRLAVDLELVDIDRPAEQLLCRPDQSWMARNLAIDIVIGMRGEVGAHLAGDALAHIFRPVLGEQRRDLALHHGDLLGTEQIGDEDIAVALELVELVLGQLHGISSCIKRGLTPRRSDRPVSGRR